MSRKLLAGKFPRRIHVRVRAYRRVYVLHNMNGICVKVDPVKGLKVVQPNTGDLLSQAVNGGEGLRGLGGCRVGEGFVCALKRCIKISDHSTPHSQGP